ncbi:S1-C subfamily serine protease [Catenuloplanes nepalensis]|uniref:S1-C subfamily serine protease n=1 Tax=Catenuloplanes nepalensis TaxID=587533 RepID=A0ABT9MVL3_9ACTN|nr:trypsin-like peptidase domain-containing protein [Catenuloplanes nepalensis]MDP9795489.1 S1-C subfamily serine protease [Catenuloplanes nepalensis]
MQTDRRAPVVMTVLRDPASVETPPETADDTGGPARGIDRRRLLIGLIVVWALVITGLVIFQGAGGEPEAAPAPVPPSPSESAGPLGVPQIYEVVRPSVVRITAEGAGESTGTGVLANADGTILTAFHVVEGARTITVTYAGGAESRATVAESDPAMDIAVLVPEEPPETLVPATIGGAAGVGDTVVAIGNPLGLTATTTSGVVSALDRTLDRGNDPDMAGLIQFDAAVNPGSSGGPLINDRAEVVGIVVALANPTDAGTFIGIGFAVPIGAALGATEGDGQAPPL